MRIPFWKRWFSYLQPMILEQTGTDLNPELTVRLDKGRLQLLSGNAIYSWDDLYRNFTIALTDPELAKKKIDDVLVLGLGLGSVPYILEHVCGRDCRFVAVEYDEAVVDLAYKYTVSRLRNPMEVIITDAELFVEICEEQFDLVIVDVFEDHKTPPQFQTTTFLRDCEYLMRPGALLLYNRLYSTQEDKDSSKDFFYGPFREVFPNSRYLDTDGYWILIGEAI